jgi:plasmid stabilization system protein ParE
VSPDSADRWLARIESAIGELADDAGVWPEADEAATLGINLRCKLFDRRRHVYRILFTIENEVVAVHRVRYAAMDWLTKDDI